MGSGTMVVTASPYAVRGHTAGGKLPTTMYSVRSVVVQEEHAYVLMKCGDVVEIPLSELRKLLAPALLEAFK